ncbi:MAG: hypothetical protein OXQ89_20115 [Rhodospirillaceae bacterium]|nr:hypothetical protein [Rhodospirillaceae bacterium]
MIWNRWQLLGRAHATVQAEKPFRTHRSTSPICCLPGVVHGFRIVQSTVPAVKLAFELLLLKAVRSGEARGATWGEVDFEAREWRVPASRMKAGGNIGCRCRMRLWPFWRA